MGKRIDAREYISIVKNVQIDKEALATKSNRYKFDKEGISHDFLTCFLEKI